MAKDTIMKRRKTREERAPPLSNPHYLIIERNISLKPVFSSISNKSKRYTVDLTSKARSNLYVSKCYSIIIMYKNIYLFIMHEFKACQINIFIYNNNVINFLEL